MHNYDIPLDSKTGGYLPIPVPK